MSRAATKAPQAKLAPKQREYLVRTKDESGTVRVRVFPSAKEAQWYGEAEKAAYESLFGYGSKLSFTVEVVQ